MSDRDKKIIIFLLLVAVIALPYVFYIKDKKVAIETTLVEVQTLEARLAELNEMNQNRDFYIREIDRMHTDRDVIVASFPADIRRENYAMFLLQTEYSSDVIEDEETGESMLEFPILFESVAFGVNSETQISSDSVENAAADGTQEPLDTEFVAISNLSALNYICYYDGLKYLLQYLKDYEDPMIYSEISMEMDAETGIVSGTMQISQYAIAGPDRTLDDVEFTIQVGDEEIDLGLDDLDMRGNEEVGIFGPITTTESEEETPAAEAEEEVPEE